MQRQGTVVRVVIVIAAMSSIMMALTAMQEGRQPLAFEPVVPCAAPGPQAEVASSLASVLPASATTEAPVAATGPLSPLATSPCTVVLSGP